MGNEFDQEMRDLRDPSSDAPSIGELSGLKEKLTSSEYFLQGNAECADVGRELDVSVKGQIIGVWKEVRGQLLLFRPGIDQPECTASSAVEAAKVSARLVAAVGQA